MRVFWALIQANRCWEYLKKKKKEKNPKGLVTEDKGKKAEIAPGICNITLFLLALGVAPEKINQILQKK